MLFTAVFMAEEMPVKPASFCPTTQSPRTRTPCSQQCPPGQLGPMHRASRPNSSKRPSWRALHHLEQECLPPALKGSSNLLAQAAPF